MTSPPEYMKGMTMQESLKAAEENIKILKNSNDTDAVNNPTHYNTGGIECIDAMEANMTPEEFQGYCKGAAFKYIWRLRYKGKPAEDMAKAVWYGNRFISSLKKEEDQ